MQWLAVILTVSLVLSWSYYYLRFSYHYSAWYIARLSGTPTAGWQLQTGRGKRVQARLRAFYFHPMLIILWFDLGGWRRYSVIASKDNIGSDALRRLRIILLDAPKPLP